MQVGIQPVSTPAACYFRPHPFHTSPEPQVEGLFLYLTLSQSSIPPEGCSEAHWNQEVERGEAENTWGSRTSVLRGQSWPELASLQGIFPPVGGSRGQQVDAWMTELVWPGLFRQLSFGVIGGPRFGAMTGLHQGRLRGRG